MDAYAPVTADGTTAWAPAVPDNPYLAGASAAPLDR